MVKIFKTVLPASLILWLAVATTASAVPFPAPPQDNEASFSKASQSVEMTNQIIIKLTQSTFPRTELAARLLIKSIIASTSTLTGAVYQRAMEDDTHIVKLSDMVTLPYAAKIAQALTANIDINYAEADRLMYPSSTVTPNDPGFYYQWGPQSQANKAGASNLTDAWGETTGSGDVVVAVVDTGVVNHADFAARLIGGQASLSGYDFVSSAAMGNDGNTRDSNPSDPGDWVSASDTNSSPFTNCYTHNSSWHGTHVAGIIGAASNNSQGVSGVDWNARLLIARALGKCGGYLSDVSEAIRWSAGQTIGGVSNPNPADIINLSLGSGGACGPTYQNAINAATNLGALVVVAAGNSNADAGNYQPANCQNVITVAALDDDGGKAVYSNSGSLVDIAAPGTSILSTLDSGATTPANNNGYNYYSGTSMATPHVSGVLSLMLAANDHLTDGSIPASQIPALLKTKLTASASTFTSGTGNDCTTSTCGSGALDAYAAVMSVKTLPSANAGADQTVTTGSSVTLTGLGTDTTPGGAIAGYAWQQTAGTNVSLQNSNTANPTFTAPGVAGTLTFQLTVTNNVGLTSTSTVDVTVESGASSSPCIGAASNGSSMAGQWSADCDSENRSGRYARYYSFSMSSPGTITASLDSSQDTYLFLLDGNGTQGQVLAANDDSNGTTNSQITQSLAAGFYTLEATTYQAGRVGDFTLQLDAENAAVEPTGCTASISPGQQLAGDWNVDCDSENRSGRYARYYTFSLSAATTVNINLDSSEDTYLFLLAGNDSQGTVLASNDDSGGTTNSAIERSLSAGTYTIEATTYAAARNGSFTVNLTAPNAGGGNVGGSNTGGGNVGGENTGDGGVNLGNNEQQLEFTIRWDTEDDRYHVFMRPTGKPEPIDASLTGQFTVLVPHSNNIKKRFVFDRMHNTVASTFWVNSSRIDAPVENPAFDYVSFRLSTLDPSAFAWQAGVEQEVFSFANWGGECLGVVKLIDNQNDPFNEPVLEGNKNSAGTNPGNQFTNLGWGSSAENNYLGIYGEGADCNDSLDNDNDGLKNGVETRLGTNPDKADSDFDGVPDLVEIADPDSPVDTDKDGKIDALDTDDDNDGIMTFYEKYTANSPLDEDTDGDKIPDYLDTDDDGDEIATVKEQGDPNGDGNPDDAIDTDSDKTPDYLDSEDNAGGFNTGGPTGDPDQDGLTNEQEIALGTDPEKADSDGDFLPDGVEVNTTNTDPTKADSDDDGLDDGVEINVTNTNPNKADSDSDGLNDNEEVNDSGSDPMKSDSDADGVDDKTEVGMDVKNPIDSDSDNTPDVLDTDDDNDGVNTVFENYDGDTTPLNDDTDSDTIPDYLDKDDDGDSLLSEKEQNDPNADNDPADAVDTDGDGKPNYLDSDDSDGPNADPDDDGLTNAEEFAAGTDRDKADSDGDGLTDGEEYKGYGTDPNSEDSDNDGTDDMIEIGFGLFGPADTDKDGIIDALDADDDGDGVLSVLENYDGDTKPSNDDTDKDKIPDYLDTDDDNDGIPSDQEGNDPNKDGDPADALDTDSDGIPDYLDDRVDNLTVKVKVMLQGAYKIGDKMMRDDLRVKALIPSAQPYDSIAGINYDGVETLSPSLLTISGNNAVVDWVLIEARDADDPTVIKARTAALVQRDGDVVDATTGETALELDGLTAGKYFIAVRHRNHLAVMTANLVNITSSSVETVDFTQSSTLTYGDYARTAYGDDMLLWAGDARSDGGVTLNGPANDTVIILTNVLIADDNILTSSNYLVPGYHSTDINMDGITVFAGPSNEVDLLFGNVLLHPENPTYSANFIIAEQMP